MSRIEDLEASIRESYDLIKQHEDIIRVSERPEEELRSERMMQKHWALIEKYLQEYARLADEAFPPDIAEIAARFAKYPSPEHGHPDQKTGAQPKLSQQVNVSGEGKIEGNVTQIGEHHGKLDLSRRDS